MEPALLKTKNCNADVDYWWKPTLNLSLQPDSSLSEAEKVRFEQQKKHLLKDSYFCSWSERQIAESLLLNLDRIARYHQLWYRGARITFEKGYWGKCMGDNTILINFNVVLLPLHLREYLFLHELVHTKVNNHGDEFWRLMDFCANGKAQALEKEFNRYGMRITV